MEAILGILIAALLSENFILVKFYGICPFMGVSKKIDTALGMGMAVTFVMALAAAVCYGLNLALVALNLEYMQTVVFILTIASLVQVVEMFLKKFVPALYSALGVYLPLITTNCAVLGVVLVNVQEGYNFLQSTVNGAAGGLGFTLAIVLFASLRERVDKAECPESFKGYPLALIAAGFLAVLGGRRTEEGRMAMGQVLSLRRYLRKLTPKQIQQHCRDNPEFFFDVAPYAIALGCDGSFARHFGKSRLPLCPYVQAGNTRGLTAKQWSQLMRQILDGITARQRKSPMEGLRSVLDNYMK